VTQHSDRLGKRTRRVVLVDKSKELASVGLRVRRRREKLGLTQQQVAAGRYTPAYISALERGLAAPSFASMLHLSKMLKVRPAWFLEGL
jgi:transcriptional regulator with XRE-family HTH domain